MRLIFRIVSILVIVLVLLAALAAGLAYFNRKAAAEWFLRGALAVRGYPAATFEITELNPNDARLENLVLRPDGLEVAQVDIDYALPDVLRGQIKSATVTGAALAIDLDAPSGGGDPFEIDLAPLESTGAALTLESALITVTGGLVGTLEIEIDAQADFSQDQAPMALSVEARADNNTLKLDRFTYTAERVFEGDERLTFAGNLDAALAHWHLSGWTLSDTDYAGA